MNPKISVIICTYNRAHYIVQAIESVLRQDFTDLEIIIIDDASNDNTGEIVKKYSNQDPRIKYFLNEHNLGIAKNRNKGVRLARGQYIAMLDSDDYWIGKDKLQKQFAFLEAWPEVGLIGTDISRVDENSLELGKDYFETVDSAIRKKILLRNQFAQSSILFRKDVFNNVGGYDESFSVAEDYDLWLRMGKISKLANLKETATAYRLHIGSISKNRIKEMILMTDKIIVKNKECYPNYFLAKIKSVLRLIKVSI